MSSAAMRYIDRSAPAETMDYGVTVDGQNQNLTIGVHGTLEHNVKDHPTESTSGWSEKDK